MGAQDKWTAHQNLTKKNDEARLRVHLFIRLGEKGRKIPMECKDKDESFCFGVQELIIQGTF